MFPETPAASRWPASLGLRAISSRSVDNLLECFYKELKILLEEGTEMMLQSRGRSDLLQRVMRRVLPNRNSTLQNDYTLQLDPLLTIAYCIAADGRQLPS